MRAARVLDVAAYLELKTAPPRGASQGQIFGCPACGAERRHTKSRDRRGAIGVGYEGRGWACYQCSARGGPIDLVAYALYGVPYRELRGDPTRRTEVRARCIDFTGIATVVAHPQGGVDATEPPHPTYPPLDEVEALWVACVPVYDVQEVRDWLATKRIDPITVADADLARAIPNNVVLPAWARFGGAAWHALGYRLIVPQVDATAAMRSVVARNVLGRSPKSLPPKAYKRKGLVFACPLARQLLKRSARPEWWGDAELRVEVPEGEKKFLQRVTAKGDASEFAPACIGVGSGSWSDELAGRLPDGVTLYLCTDPNSAGAKYATDVIRSLSDRVASRAVHVELRHEFALRGTGDDLSVEVAA